MEDALLAYYVMMPKPTNLYDCYILTAKEITERKRERRKGGREEKISLPT